MDSLVSICKDHKGGIERENVIIHNIKTYYDIRQKTYLITFGMDDYGIYCSFDFTHYKNDDRFFKIKNIPIQISKELLDVYERALGVYLSGVRDDKLLELGIV